MCWEVKDKVMPKECLSMVWPKKIALFQITKIPPEAPSEGMKSNLSKRRGAKFLISGISKFHSFVSCKQTIEQPLSSILSRTASCFSVALRPLMFQQSTFQFLVFMMKQGGEQTEAGASTAQENIHSSGNNINQQERIHHEHFETRATRSTSKNTKVRIQHHKPQGPK